MRSIFIPMAALLLALLPTGPVRSDNATNSLSGDAALQKLMQANRRYAVGKSLGPNRQVKRRLEVAAAQHPFAVVVTCSDSRVPPEILFDQGIGDLFVIRLAGNVVDDVAMGSVEYGVVKLGARLIVVLGHSQCGAVVAAVKGDPVPGQIGAVVEAIQPAVAQVKGHPGDLLENAIEENAREGAAKLKASSLLSERVRSGQLKVVSAVYELKTGRVKLLK